jgi:flagellar basal-body rod protein FlgC
MMNFFDAMSVSASGLSAQRLRMNLISSNLANINTTKTESGEPYRRKDAVFAAEPQESSFDEALSKSMQPGLSEVRVEGIRTDNRPFIQKYDPENPDADAKGYVSLPNINVVEEMVNMLSATRSYEANVTAVTSTKEMANQALEIGR